MLAARPAPGWGTGRCTRCRAKLAPTRPRQRPPSSWPPEGRASQLTKRDEPAFPLLLQLSPRSQMVAPAALDPPQAALPHSPLDRSNRITAFCRSIDHGRHGGACCGKRDAPPQVQGVWERASCAAARSAGTCAPTSRLERRCRRPTTRWRWPPVAVMAAPPRRRCSSMCVVAPAPAPRPPMLSAFHEEQEDAALCLLMLLRTPPAACGA